jgi:hypothetical protein
MSPVNQVLDLLVQLSQGELDQVRAACTTLKMLGPGKQRQLPKQVDTQEHLILDEIVVTLRNMGVEFASPSMLRQNRGYQKFSEKVPGIIQFLNAATTNRVDQRAVLALGIRLLYKQLESWGLPVTALVIMNNAYRIPSLINRAFPGYARSGMLSWIIRKEALHVRDKRGRQSVQR